MLIKEAKNFATGKTLLQESDWNVKASPREPSSQTFSTAKSQNHSAIKSAALFLGAELD